MTESLPDLDGKILYVYVGNLSKSFDDGITLEACALRTLGGRTFLVGRTVDRCRPEWSAGPETSVAWEAVTAFLVYPSRDEFAAAVDRSAQGGARGPGFLHRIFGKA
jgi:hypothetical protein